MVDISSIIYIIYDEATERLSCFTAWGFHILLNEYGNSTYSHNVICGLNEILHVKSLDETLAYLCTVSTQ